jgi:DNA-binding transcriptional LysR family regulator
MIFGTGSSDLLYVSDPRLGLPDAELEFRPLEYFVAVAEELHFGRAASRVFISQPALSQAIAGLERTLDVKLFVRTRQNVELTDAGAELLRHARGMLADREDAVAAVRSVDRGETGVLRVGVALLAEHEIAPAFAAFTTEYPEAVLDRSGAVSERLLSSVQDRSLHAALVYRLPVLPTLEGVEWEVIRRGGLAALISGSSALADRESVNLAELSEETFLVPPRALGPSAFEGLKTMCLTYGGFEPKTLELSTSTNPLGGDWQPVIEGDVIALMADATARAIRPDGAVAVPIDAPPEFELAVAWRTGNGAPMLDRFLAFIRAYRDAQGWTDGTGESTTTDGPSPS